MRFDLLDRRVPIQPRAQALVKKWVDTAYRRVSSRWFRSRGGGGQHSRTAGRPGADGQEPPGNLTTLITEAMQSAAKSDAAVLNGGSIRIDDQLPAGPVRQYDIIRVLPFGGKVVKVTLDGACCGRFSRRARRISDPAGFCSWQESPAAMAAGR